MLATGHFIALASATLRGGRPATPREQTRHTFRVVMRAARDWWANGTVKEIARRTGHSVWTVRRWMRGETVPGIDVGFDLIRSDRGPSVILLIAEELPAKRRAAFFKELVKVSQRAELRARLEALED